jgi:hypothetical protein
MQKAESTTIEIMVILLKALKDSVANTATMNKEKRKTLKLLLLKTDIKSSFLSWILLIKLNFFYLITK